MQECDIGDTSDFLNLWSQRKTSQVTNFSQTSVICKDEESQKLTTQKTLDTRLTT